LSPIHENQGHGEVVGGEGAVALRDQALAEALDLLRTSKADESFVVFVAPKQAEMRVVGSFFCDAVHTGDDFLLTMQGRVAAVDFLLRVVEAAKEAVVHEAAAR